MIKIIESTDNKHDEIIISVRDNDKALYNLLQYIKSLSDKGHMFDVIVDPDTEYKKAFEIDGDGAFGIANIILNKAIKNVKIN